MAYELESQNNSTSTLVDSVTGNRIRLRSTAVIANVSYTLVKVNNNTATLQDGEGNILKDVPCVAVLYGEGGGTQVKTMPEANAGNLGKIVQYVGETTTDYTNAYFYKSSVTGTTPSSITINQTVGTGLGGLAVNKGTFETKITESGSYDFTARLNREHIIATIVEAEVRMDRDESHDVEGAIAWTPDGETYFYTEELVPDVNDDVFADPDGETVAGTVAEYNAEAIGWEFDGEFVDVSDYGITYTPADPTATVSYSSEALGTVTVDAATFATQVAESDTYIFDAVVTPERILATVGEEMIQYNRDSDSDDGDLFAWKDEHNIVVFTESATPTATAQVYSDTSKTPLGTVEAYSASSTKWYRGADEITLATYGITITGTAEDGNSIHIKYVGVPPEQDDVITVDYTAEAPTYGWVRTNVQPSGGSGGGSVSSVNNIDPDASGNVELSAENINASVGGTVDSVQDHLDSLRNDLGDLADDVAEKTVKNVIVLTGESGTLTSAQIAQVLDDTAVLEIVCDGQVFRLSNKGSTLTYRTYINSDCALNENVAFKVIYVQLNSEAVNYGAWSLEEVSAGGGNVIDDSTISTTTTWSSDKLNTMIGNVETLINAL